MTTEKDNSKRGRKAGGHNTKQEPIIGKPPIKLDDKPAATTYGCYNCAYEQESKFNYCPSCGKENNWP